MDRAVNEAVEQYAAIVKERYNPLKIYLYGSHAKGKNDENSDIDVAVVFPVLNHSDYMTVFGDLFLLAADVDSRIEPNIFIDDGNIDRFCMLYEVVKTGQEI